MNNNNTNIVKGFATAAGEGERIWFVADTLTLKATAASERPLTTKVRATSSKHYFPQVLKKNSSGNVR